VERRLVYPNGDVWNSVDLFELRNDKLIKVYEYFAASFPAAEWRAKWSRGSNHPPGGGHWPMVTKLAY